MSRSIGGTAMVIALVTLSGTVVATVLASAPTPLPPDPDGFAEDFSAATLDPAWTVVQTFPGGTPRAHGFTASTAGTRSGDAGPGSSAVARCEVSGPPRPTERSAVG